jgi:protoheme IX farnesyltransferase
MKGSTITETLKTYYRLTKPERTLTNTMTAVAGFLFASRWHIDWGLFAALFAGVTLVIASACVMNNLLDRKLDKKMSRTRNRALPAGKVSPAAGLVLGIVLGVAGFGILSLTNPLTMAVIGVGYVGYVAVYGWSKRHTIHSTLIGTIPGGASLVAGYTAVTGQLDKAAVILFVIMLAWQMAHFYAIAVYRLKDYSDAKLPVLPVKKGVKAAKKQVLAYTLLFLFAASLLTWEDYTGYVFLAAVLLISVVWLKRIIEDVPTDEQWGKGVFKASLSVLVITSVLLALGPVLP